jgi:hypothetical protein
MLVTQMSHCRVAISRSQSYATHRLLLTFAGSLLFLLTSRTELFFTSLASIDNSLPPWLLQQFRALFCLFTASRIARIPP